MKCAILSDIHGNAAALRAVVDAARAQEARLYLIAGDLVGYYYRPDEVMDIIESLECCVIRGNHEDMFREWCNSTDIRNDLERKYGSSFNQTNSMSNKRQSFIKTLPETKELEVDGASVLMCHGAPWDHDKYIYPDTPAENVDRMFSYDRDLLVMGHTHYPVIWERDGRVALNPGSVGQPRDKKGGACWALWDSETRRAELKRELYDVTPVLADCQRYNPDLPYLQEVLTRRV